LIVAVVVKVRVASRRLVHSLCRAIAEPTWKANRVAKSRIAN
jgi:hypothetical protein